ncbi:unnamed protein product [Rhodiola kirilowii]
MGLSGVLGRTVFSKTRSFGTAAGHEQHHHHHNGRGKRSWSSVRSYLCGDELFDSVLAEEDSTSVKTFVSGKTSEATVTQPMLTDEIGSSREDQSLDDYISHTEQQAAIRIQSAFRSYLARRGEEQAFLPEMTSNVEESESVCTSLEVQTANSVTIFSVTQRANAQPFKLKEDWDDSTVSSNISKMRMQNRLEAMTRRERALAYAFSQQLRICSKKKASKSDNEETNTGWSWLERWMATRVRNEDDFHTSKLHDTVISNKPISPAKTKSFESAKEEKESCGSNEVFLQFSSNFSINSPLSAHESMPVKISSNNRPAIKVKRVVSKRKTVPSCKEF